MQMEPMAERLIMNFLVNNYTPDKMVQRVCFGRLIPYKGMEKKS